MPFADYTSLEEVARGGMGVIYRARDPQGQPVAIKCLLDRDQPNAVSRFRREGKALELLRHPHVVRVLEVGDAPEGPFLVLEWVEGESLQARLDREKLLTERATARLMLQLADAVAHAHAVGVLHRDLTPNNVLFDAQGDAQLTDFGLARELDPTGSRTALTLRGRFLGTLGYASPEQVSGEPDRIGPAVDVYGLGAVFYAALTGRPPLDGESALELAVATLDQAPLPPSQLRPGLDPELEALCLACLAKRPERRPTLRQLLGALSAWLGIAPQRAAPLPNPGVDPEAETVLNTARRGADPHLPPDPEADTVLQRRRPQGDPPAPVQVPDPDGPGFNHGFSRIGYLGVRGPLTPAQEVQLAQVLTELQGLEPASARDACREDVVTVIDYASEEACEVVAKQLVALGFEGQLVGRRPHDSFTPMCPVCSGSGDETPLSVRCPRCRRRFHQACAPASGVCTRCQGEA